MLRHTWHVLEIEGVCSIWRGDGLVKQTAPRNRLRQAMYSHGVMRQTYDDLCRQLDETGKASILANEMIQISQVPQF